MYSRCCLDIDSEPLETSLRKGPDVCWGCGVKLGVCKIHVGVDASSELPIAVEATSADVHEARLFSRLLWRSMTIGGLRIVEGESSSDTK
ncbi:MAG: hypothetical protein QXK69_12825 [Candidatus Caldarchaeum sp.]